MKKLKLFESHNFTSTLKYQDMLQRPDSVVIGSRAFNVHDKDSDYDICLPRSAFEDLDDRNLEDKCNIRKYFRLLPPLGNNLVIRDFIVQDLDETIDILIFDDIKSINIIKEVVEELRLFPEYYLKDKQNRVSLFETGLRHYGFVDSMELE